MHLKYFTALARRYRERDGGGLSEVLEAELLKVLGWPDDVVEQWLYDRSGLAVRVGQLCVPSGTQRHNCKRALDQIPHGRPGRPGST